MPRQRSNSYARNNEELWEAVLSAGSMQKHMWRIGSWCERWNIQINENKTQEIYFFRRLLFPDDEIKLNGRDIPFVNNESLCQLRQEDNMEIQCGKDCIQGLARKYVRTYSKVGA
jgi:hypothetical protein